MFNMSDLNYLPGDILIKRDDDLCAVAAIDTSSYVRDAMENIDALSCRVEAL